MRYRYIIFIFPVRFWLWFWGVSSPAHFHDLVFQTRIARLLSVNSIHPRLGMPVEPLQAPETDVVCAQRFLLLMNCLDEERLLFVGFVNQ